MTPALLWVLLGGCGPEPTGDLREVVVRGTSLSGRVEHGDVVRVDGSPEARRAVARGDLVVVRRPDGEALLKVVHAVPGDAWAVEGTPEGRFRVVVNGEAATTSTGVPFRLDREAGRLLALYVRDYDGRIPEDAFLVLGNRETGTLDSGRFGLVARQDVLAVGVEEGS